MASAPQEGEVAFDAPGAGKPCKTWYKIYGSPESHPGPALVALHGGPAPATNTCLPSSTSTRNTTSLSCFMTRLRPLYPPQGKDGQHNVLDLRPFHKRTRQLGRSPELANARVLYS